MLSKSLFSFSALVCLAAAVPLQKLQFYKRDVVWTTEVVQEFVTVTVATTTVHLAPGQSPPAAAPQGPAGQPPVGHGHANHHRPQITSHIKSTVTVHRVPPASQNTQAPPPSKPTTPAAPPPAPETTSQATPSPNTPAPATPSSGDHNKPKKPSSGNGGGGSHGTTHTGDITYYAPGLGSCGITNSASDHIVALAEDMMLPKDGANPNANPLCGRSITISHGGKTAVATIEDTCPGCAGASLDLTPTLFEIFAPLGTGRVSGVEWWFN